MVVGAGLVGLALTAVLLPDETAFLGMSSSHLCHIDHCRLLNFIAHGRMSYGGALIAIGVMTGWLTARPLWQGETWAWWVVALAALATYGTALAFLLYGGFFDWGYVVFIAFWLLVGASGLVLVGRSSLLEDPIASFSAPGLRDWTRTPEGIGRAFVIFLGLSVVAAGMGIWAIASSVVFVPQDIAFLDVDTHQVSAISPKLMPLLSHDRVEYGGGMVALGALFAATAWKALNPLDQGAWRALLASGAIFYGSTIVIHIAIGYTNLVHLMPVYAGLFMFLISLAVVRISARPPETVSAEPIRSSTL